MTEPMTLAEALAYLKPDPANNGTISLRGPKAREAVEVIEAELAALRAQDREGARKMHPAASHAQLRYLARVASSPAPLGAIGCSRPIADKLTALGLWAPEQVRSHHRDRTYYRITETGLSAIKALPLSPVRTEDGSDA